MLKRLATLAAAGALIGVPVACTAQPAFAADSLAADSLAVNSVTFTGGGLGMLLCGSEPDRPEISVAAETALRLTNGLNTGAQLTIDGDPTAFVAQGETVEVQFHRGPVAVTMVPDCGMNISKAKRLTVQVRSPAQIDDPGTPPSTKAPGHGPRGGADGQAPPADPPTGRGVPAGGTSASGTGLEPPVTIVNPDGSLAQTFTGNKAPTDRGPIGLLAIIATVCVVGVSAGAIRAIITQRASRPESA